MKNTNKATLIGLIIVLVVMSGCKSSQPDYTYVGTIKDIEGGSSRSSIILTLEDGQKVIYTTTPRCSNKIRLGQEVYSKRGSNYLWVEYETDKFC